MAPSRRRSIRVPQPPPIIRTSSPPSPIKTEGSPTKVSDGGWDRRSPSPTPFLQVPGASGDDSRPPSLTLTADEPFYDPKRLSPVAATYSGLPLLLQPDMAGLGIDENIAAAPDDDVSPTFTNPFNFQTQVISTSPVKPTVGQRRGHRYKHSSISAQHQIFLEPPQRPPLVLPASLPIPTFREAWRSVSREQRARLYWCLCHAFIAILVFLSAHGSLAMTALSHLVFFDVGSALLSVGVDVVGNFEVWKRSSIRHPFGLERAEVLAGFAMSVFLVFGGFDLVSHDLKHVLEGVGGHEAHHPDPHGAGVQGPQSHHDHEERIRTGEIDWASIAAIFATLISAYGLRNQKRISRMMRVSYLASLPSILSNPFHFLTLSTSFLMLLLPLLSIQIPAWFDRGLCLMIAMAMFGLGFRLAVAQGLMLLMSFGGRPNTSSASATFDSKGKNIDSSGNHTGVSDVLREIEAEQGVERVEDAQFWQVHYGLCMANLKVCVSRGCDDTALTRLRGRIATLIQNRLGEGYGRGGSLRWEVSLQMSCDK